MRVAMDNGVSKMRAAQLSAYRYSPIGQETRDRMRSVFPNSRIYGFHSLSPLGRRIVPRLRDYFEAVPDYKAHLQGFPTEQENKFWSSAMKGQWIRSVNGDSGIENPFCILDSDKPIYQKLDFVNEALSDEIKSLAYMPLIESYLNYLEALFGLDRREELPSFERGILESIQFNEKARSRFDGVFLEPVIKRLKLQVQMADYGQRLGWYDYDNKEDAKRLMRVLVEGGLFEENLNGEQLSLICYLDTEWDLRLEDLPEESWNVSTILALGCLRPGDDRIHLALSEQLLNEDLSFRKRKSLEIVLKLIHETEGLSTH